MTQFLEQAFKVDPSREYIRRPIMKTLVCGHRLVIKSYMNTTSTYASANACTDTQFSNAARKSCKNFLVESFTRSPFSLNNLVTLPM